MSGYNSHYSSSFSRHHVRQDPYVYQPGPPAGAAPYGYQQGPPPVAAPLIQQNPYGYQPGPPSGADPQLWQWFCAVDTDRSGSISVTELQDALVNGNWTKFDLDTVKMLMNIFDTDRTGTIEFHEFVGLWKYVADWQRVFKHFDRDHSGTIEGHELAEALRTFGYELSPPLLRTLEIRYASGAPSAYGPPPGITFDRFVRACVTVKTLTEMFRKADHDNDGWIQLNQEEFLKMVMCAP